MQVAPLILMAVKIVDIPLLGFARQGPVFLGGVAVSRQVIGKILDLMSFLDRPTVPQVATPGDFANFLNFVMVRSYVSNSCGDFIDILSALRSPQKLPNWEAVVWHYLWNQIDISGRYS